MSLTKSAIQQIARVLNVATARFASNLRELSQGRRQRRNVMREWRRDFLQGGRHV
jgi:hypothetical protein